MAKRINKKQSKSRLLKVEALEQRQLLASGFTAAQGQEFADISHPNGNVYDQILLKSSAITVVNDAGQVTRVSFLDAQGDIVQAEFSGKGSLNISMDATTFATGQAPTNYLQTGIEYVKGNATFTVQGSDSTTNLTIFSVGSGQQYVNPGLFDATHQGGDHVADVQRITVVADPSNPNGSLMGGIRAGNAIFSAESGLVGITASNVQVQNAVVVGDIVAKGTATPVLVFGTDSQFVEVQVAGGGLLSGNGKPINNTGSYLYGVNLIAGTKSDGSPDAVENTYAQMTFTGANPVGQIGKTVSLTGGVDNVLGGTGNDLFVGNKADNTAVFFTSLDKIDGGTGTDTLSIVSTAAIDTTTAINTTVTNVENVELQSTLSVTANTTAWTGVTGLNAVSIGGVTLTASGTTVVNATDNTLGVNAASITGGSDVNLTAIGQTTGGITLSGGKGIQTVSATGDYAAADVTLGAISVTGGTEVSVSQTSGITTTEINAAKPTGVNNFTLTQSNVSVTGDATTKTVSVKQSATVAEVDETDANGTDGKIGVTTGTVTINDLNRTSGTAAGSIESVTLNSFGTTTIDSSAIKTVTLSGTGGALTINRGALSAVPTANTLTVNVSGLSGDTATTITDGEAATDDGFTTVEVVGTGSNSTINDITFADATTLNVSGTSKVTFSNTTGIGNVTAINVTTTGGSSFGTQLGTGVTFTGGSGGDAITIGATTKALTTGAGDDTVTIAATALGTGGSVEAGDGTDTLSMTAAQAITASSVTTFESAIGGFERLSLGAVAATGDVKLNNLDDLNYVTIAGVDVGQTLTLSSANSGMTLVSNNNVAGSVAIGLANSSSNDVLNVNISANNASRTIFALDTSGFETLNFNTDNSNSNPNTQAHVITTLAGAGAATTIKVTGDAGLTVTTGTSATALTLLDASGVTKGAVKFTTGALSAAATLTGGAGDDVLTAIQATKVVTLNGGAGNDTLTGSATQVNTLNGGDGNDTLKGGAVADTADGGAGSADVFAPDNVLTEQAGVSNTVGVVVNLSDTALTQSAIFTATGNAFLASGSSALATNSATYLFDGESSTNASIVDTFVNIEGAMGTTGTDYLVGSGSANTLIGGAGNDLIVTGDGSDTVVMTSTTGTDTVTDFTKGAGGDIVAFSLAGLGQTFFRGTALPLVAVTAGAATVVEVAAATTLGANDNVIVLNGTFGSSAAMLTAIGGGSHAVTWGNNPVPGSDIVVVWSDGTDTFVSLVNDADTTDTNAMLAAELSVTATVATLKGVNGTAAGSFVSSNFTFVA